MTTKTALVVDDSRSARYAMRKFLESAGYTVDTAESAQDAYVYLQRRHPQVIFLDHQMPGSDGLDVLRVLKDDIENTNIPVVLCSGQEDESFQRVAQEAGALAVLPKPPDAEKLKALLRHLHGETQYANSSAHTRTPPSLGLPPRHLTASGMQRPQPSVTTVEANTSQRAAENGVVNGKLTPETSSSEIQELRQAITALQNELAELRQSREVPGQIAPERLTPQLLDLLDAPMRKHAQRAVGQILQQSAERMLQEARALIAGANDSDAEDGGA